MKNLYFGRRMCRWYSENWVDVVDRPRFSSEVTASAKFSQFCGLTTPRTEWSMLFP